MLRRIENRGALETAHRALQNCGQIMRYAIATGRAERDIAADLKGSIPPPQERHHPSITDPKQIGQLLRAIDGYTGDLPTLCALRLAGQSLDETIQAYLEDKAYPAGFSRGLHVGDRGDGMVAVVP